MSIHNKYVTSEYIFTLQDFSHIIKNFVWQTLSRDLLFSRHNKHLFSLLSRTRFDRRYPNSRGYISLELLDATRRYGANK